MGYTLEAFFAPSTVFDRAKDHRPMMAVVPLAQQFALLPLTDEFRDSFASITPAYAAFYKLTPALADWANELSRMGAIAYLEAEFFGGTGTHAAIVWKGGKVVLGPLHTEVRWDGKEIVAPPIRQNAFNQALRYFGVTLGNSSDEFEALELGRHRGTESWAKDAE